MKILCNMQLLVGEKCIFMQNFAFRVTKSDIYHNAAVSIYPDGRSRIVVVDRPIFKAAGWEAADRQPDKARPTAKPEADAVGIDGEAGDQNGDQRTEAKPTARAVHRATAAIRDIVLCNEWDFWVTLTIDAAAVDRYDWEAQQRKLRPILGNLVQRHGCRYVLIPELHQDGAIHYHGFVAGMRAEWSGTMQPPDGGKPRRVKSADRAQREAEGWHDVFNLPEWPLGFSTAIRLYGDRLAAARYACKYATKMLSEGAKIGGRYYLSGGKMQRKPERHLTDIDPEDLRAAGAWEGELDFGGGRILVLWEGEKK